MSVGGVRIAGVRIAGVRVVEFGTYIPAVARRVTQSIDVRRVGERVTTNVRP